MLVLRNKVITVISCFAIAGSSTHIYMSWVISAVSVLQQDHNAKLQRAALL